MNANVSIVHGHDAVRRALTAAAGLLDRTGAPFCNRPLWLSTWYAHAKAAPLGVVVEEAGTVVGLACLAVARTGPLRTVTLAGDGPSDYGRLPALGESAAAGLADGILASLHDLRGPWRLRLAQVPVGDPVAGILLDALPGTRLGAGQGCPAMCFGPDRTVEKLVSAKARRSAKQGRARLDRAAVALGVERIHEPDRVRALLPEIVALHRSRDRALGRRSDLDQASRRAFWVDAVNHLARAGQLDIWVLRLDGSLAAYVVGVRDGTSYRTLDARIADLWPEASPGQLLRMEMISALLAEPGLTELDWMRGESRNKMQHATHVVRTEELLAESSPAVSGALRGWHALRTDLRDRVPTQARKWIRSRTATISAPLPGSRRSRAEHATPVGGPAAHRPPDAAGGRREPS